MLKGGSECEVVGKTGYGCDAVKRGEGLRGRRPS